MMKKLYSLILTILILWGFTLPFSPSFAQEPNTLSYGETVEGVLDENGEAVWTFAGNSGDVVWISFESDEFDTYLILTSPSGTIVGEDDDSGEFLNARLVAILPEDGTYTIQGQSLFTSDIVAAPYSLAVKLLETQTLTYGDSITGALNDGIGVFVFNGDSEDVVQIRVASEDFYVVTQLVGTFGTVMAEANGEDSIEIARQLALDGNYFIVVSSFSELEGDFTLDLTELTVAEEGGELPLDETVYGVLREASVLWTFEGTTDNPIHIEVGSNAFDVFITLLDDQGNEVATDDDSGQGTDAQLWTYLPQDGFYTILVRPLAEAEGGLYTVRAGFFEPTPIEYGFNDTGNLNDEGFAAYQFTGLAGDAVNIGATSEQFDPYVRLFSTNGLVAENDDIQFGVDINARIENTLLDFDSAEYLIIVTTSFGDPVENATFNLDLSLGE